MFIKLNKVSLALFACVYLSGCHRFPSVEDRVEQGVILLEQAKWTLHVFNDQTLKVPIFYSLSPQLNSIQSHTNKNHVTVFIEGDGLAWISARKSSLNPTPIDPVALRSAVSHTKTESIYLARPCQYLVMASCQQSWWTDARFSKEILKNYEVLLNQLKAQYGIQSMTLVGYSGGAQIALFLAAERTDISSVITLAGVLDHKAWTESIRVSPLTGSMITKDLAKGLMNIKQIHWFGTEDTVVKSEFFRDYITQSQSINAPITIHQKKEFGHRCCWAEFWQELYLKSQ